LQALQVQLDVRYFYTHFDVAWCVHMSVCLCVGQTDDPCKNGMPLGQLAWTQEPCIRRRYIWAPPGEYDWTIHAQQGLGLCLPLL